MSYQYTLSGDALARNDGQAIDLSDDADTLPPLPYWAGVQTWRRQQATLADLEARHIDPPSAGADFDGWDEPIDPDAFDYDPIEWADDAA